MTSLELKALQIAAGMTSQEVADKMGVSLSTVEKWRRGKRTITKHMAELIRMKINTSSR